MAVESGQQLSHYRLIDKIGEGGMGVVWRAEDTVLDRTVAIKVLPAQTSRNASRREMFFEEARLASSVSDAHIVQVYEFGQQSDLDFIVMEFVDGKPLGKLMHGRPLPADKVAELGLQIAKGLARAHHKDLVHRDLKPANVLVTREGDVKIVDFGLATLFDKSRSGMSDEPTRPSDSDAGGSLRTPRLVGTVPYMSPEQLRGEPLDPRTDIFSLGVILYEMATGQRPFSGATNTELAQEIMRARLIPPQGLVPKLPMELCRIVEKALARHRNDRYQSMDDMVVDLKRLARDLESGSSPSYEDLVQTLEPRRRPLLLGGVVAGALLAAAAGVVAWTLRPGVALDEATILILPLEVQGQERQAEWTGIQMANALTINLAQAPSLRIPPVPAAAEVQRDGPAAVARRAGAGRVLDGTLVRAGDGLQVSLTLIDTEANQVLWGTHRTMPGDDLPGLAAALSAEVLEYLEVEPPRQYPYIEDVTGGPEMAASEELARVLGAMRSGDYEGALALVADLVAAFPDEPAARALQSYLWLNAWFVSRSESDETALQRSLDALERLDPDNPYLNVCMAFQERQDGRPGEATRRLSAVLGRTDLTPRFRAWVLRQLGESRGLMGDYATALEDLEEALRLDPASWATFAALSRLHRETGRIEDALLRARQAQALAPNVWTTFQDVGLTLGQLGRHDEAVEQFARAIELSPSQQTYALYAVALTNAGDEDAAREAARAAEQFPDSPYGCYNLASYWLLLGDSGRSIELLERAVTAGFFSRLLIEDPEFEALHGDPRFEAVVEQVKRRLSKA